jgi:hypothetical protein
MFLTYIMFLVALCLSAVAAFYSIIGLTAIFAAAVIPIVIMGSILEVAKVTVTIWLHEYWGQCKRTMKLYLVPAVFTLMVLTSMGIFGFLSKAHLDQTVPAGDIVAQVSLFDEKIRNERDTIANARTLLAQLDKAVNDISGGPDKEIKLRNGETQVQTAAERALQVRRQQARDRAALIRTIEQAQARIVTLQEERAPIASQARKVEAEVGPIKYVAALIYGDQTDVTMLERAVRWVIILIVAVFDPLAIMMLLAATESLKWERENRARRREEEHTHERSISDPSQPTPDESGPTEPESDSRTHADQSPDSDPTLAQQPDPGDSVPVRSHGTDDNQPSEHDRPNQLVPVGETVYVDWPADTEPAITEQELEGAEPDAEKVAMREWKKSHPESTIKEQRRLMEQGVIDQLPWQASLGIQADNQGRASEVRGFGIEFPRRASKGDQYLRVDMMPSRLYKYNGNKWIEVEKHLSDQYAFDTAYIDYLIGKVASGEYDADLLSDAEQEQIRQRLEDTRNERPQ